MFTGFTDKTFDFLFGIHFNNERLWFSDHKEDYKTHLLQPMTELSREVFARLIQLCPGRELLCPTFWFELTRNGWSYGLGFYEAKSATMARHRELIDRAPRRLQKLRSDLLGQTEFQLTGTPYARFKPCAVTALAGWYNYKTFSILHESEDCSQVYDGPALVERLVQGFRFLMPYYDYFYPLCQDVRAASGSERS